MIIRGDDVQKLCAQCALPGYNCPSGLVQNIESLQGFPRCGRIPKPFRPCLHAKIALALVATVDPKK